MVAAYAIHSIGRRDKDGNKEFVPASTRERPSVFQTTSEDLAKLEGLGAARAATKEEIAIAKVQSNEAPDAPAAEEPVAENGDKKAPASGADGDPKGTPKGAANKAGAKDEEI